MAEETAKLTSEVDMRLSRVERRLLAGMPLDTIASVRGGADLRERLLMEVTQFPAADRGRVQDALALASGIPLVDDPSGRRSPVRLVAGCTSRQSSASPPGAAIQFPEKL